MSIDAPVLGDTQVTKAGAYGVRHVSGGPYFPVFDSLEGWTGASVARTQLNNSAQADFYVPLHVVGVTIGLYDGNPNDYTLLTHALYLTNGAMRVMESGVIVGSAFTYVSADKLSIRVDAGVVTYRKNDTVFYTSAVAPTGAARNLVAFLYAAYDAVWNVAVAPLTVGTASGTAALLMQPLFAVGVTGGPLARSAMAFEPLTFNGGYSTAPIFNQGQVWFESFSTGADVGVNYGSAALHLEPFFARGTDGIGSIEGSINLAPFTVSGVVGLNLIVIGSMGTVGAHATIDVLQRLISLLASRAGAHDTARGYLNFELLMQEVGRLIDSADFGPRFLGLMLERIAAHASMSGNLRFVALMLSSALATGTITPQKAMVVFMIATAIAQSLEDGGTAEHDEFVTWVANESNFATSRYTGFDFNSFAKIGDEYFAARADGIYRLGGDTDVGAKILASIDYGKVKVNGGALGRVSNAYVGTSSTGRLFMRLLSDGQAYVYEARNARNVIATQRFDFGKGLRDNWFEFEIYNGDGEDFDIESIEFVPMPTQRRV